MPLRSQVDGCGAYLPRKVVSNEELAARVDTSDAWIAKRTGIRQRHLAADGEVTHAVDGRVHVIEPAPPHVTLALAAAPLKLLEGGVP